jgi:hypothetical protein
MSPGPTTEMPARSPGRRPRDVQGQGRALDVQGQGGRLDVQGQAGTGETWSGESGMNMQTGAEQGRRGALWNLRPPGPGRTGRVRYRQPCGRAWTGPLGPPGTSGAVAAAVRWWPECQLIRLGFKLRRHPAAAAGHKAEAASTGGKRARQCQAERKLEAADRKGVLA